MGRLFLNDKVVKEWGDAKLRKVEEEKDLNKFQKRKFRIVKTIILVLFWVSVYFFNPIWYIVIISLISLIVIGTKASLVREVKVY